MRVRNPPAWKHPPSAVVFASLNVWPSVLSAWKKRRRGSPRSPAKPSALPSSRRPAAVADLERGWYAETSGNPANRASRKRRVLLWLNTRKTGLLRGGTGSTLDESPTLTVLASQRRPSIAVPTRLIQEKFTLTPLTECGKLRPSERTRKRDCRRFWRERRSPHGASSQVILRRRSRQLPCNLER